MAMSLRRLANEILAAGKPATNIGYAVGHVESVTSGVATITVLGVQQQVSYLGTAPSAGATVAVLFTAGSPLILGTISGVPTF